MAIGANGGLEVLLLGGLLAVNRVVPVAKMVFVASAADVWNREVPFLAFLRAARRDVEAMHVVAVAADGHQLGRIILVRLGVEGFPVGGDVVGDDAQARLFGSLAEFLGFFPEVEVALGAFGLLDRSRFRMRRDAVGDFQVACHAIHPGMHALAVLVGDDGLDRALVAIRAEHFELALLAVVAGLAGGVVEFWSDDGCSRRGCIGDAGADQGGQKCHGGQE
jgi:hypothetical protein